jgi:NADPH:quinone reductase-like Zn-dependent oxidoreductase
MGDVPPTMRAAIIRTLGTPDNLTIEERPTPRPGRDDVLIRVHSVGLNHLDVFARQGLKGPGIPPMTLPHVSGVDVAGVIAGLGAAVEGPPVGTRALVNPAIGCGVCRQCRRPFERVAEAEDALDRREHFGKIVVQVTQ